MKCSILVHRQQEGSRAFSVIRAPVAGAPLNTLAHETRPQSCAPAHDVQQNDGNGSATPYAHGYRFTGQDGSVYHDVMAYNPGDTVPFYSNPRIVYAGVSLGDPQTADVATATFTLTAPIVAAYRSTSAFPLVQRLYNEVLGRAPDPGGFTFWTTLRQPRSGNPHRKSVLPFTSTPPSIATPRYTESL